MDKGFLELISPDAFRGILTGFAHLPGEDVPLAEAAGRFLARPVTAGEDLPALSRSGMDGYAVRPEDTFGATETNPAYLDLAGTLDIAAVSREPLENGRCVRLVTGSSLPPGAGAVVMVEHTQDLGAGTIEIRRPAAPGENVMLAGEDARAGETALPAGTLLRPAEIAFLAALGVESVHAGRRPRAAVLSTGDEIVPHAARPLPGQIRDANRPALFALCAQTGASTLDLGIARDDLGAIAEGMARGLEEADAVFLSGGSSVGVRDLTVEALARIPGAEVLAHGLALSPGKPTILARARGKAVWGLPGQITSAQVVMFLFGCPFLERLAGDVHAFTRARPAVQARLTRNLASRQGREDWVRVRLAPSGGPLPDAFPVLGKSGLVKTLVQAQGLLRIPAGLEGLEAGSSVEVMLL
ncbi:Molybdopterin molybdenumtransferase [Fundidesulfovibrio magnetotacticus]|uniref:Molybdopterin molybdenumtransferase n=1 Tax=Fundidesulfovibrio magnetotacticus TaxID=2730080 RepID=A0A6V8LM09_9BACT|nr:gephyrin-like molybdotransferase Glp [Fundidesulfovibrio magnetotacticus]GFK93712.1 Molybdopterin molybdenumtransferase [Fundidesulfovibrio magnetotacticus]